MKLYELQRGDKFRINDGSGFEEVYTLERLDGMYSICLTKDNTVVHLAVWTPVKKVEE